MDASCSLPKGIGCRGGVVARRLSVTTPLRRVVGESVTIGSVTCARRDVTITVVRLSPGGATLGGSAGWTLFVDLLLFLFGRCKS
jgi:hypothetical protein